MLEIGPLVMFLHCFGYISLYCVHPRSHIFRTAEIVFQPLEGKVSVRAEFIQVVILVQYIALYFIGWRIDGFLAISFIWRFLLVVDSDKQQCRRAPIGICTNLIAIILCTGYSPSSRTP